MGQFFVQKKAQKWSVRSLLSQNGYGDLPQHTHTHAHTRTQTQRIVSFEGPSPASFVGDDLSICCVDHSLPTSPTLRRIKSWSSRARVESSAVRVSQIQSMSSSIQVRPGTVQSSAAQLSAVQFRPVQFTSIQSTRGSNLFSPAQRPFRSGSVQSSAVQSSVDRTGEGQLHITLFRVPPEAR